MKQNSAKKLTLALAIVYWIALVWIVLFKTIEPWRIAELDRLREINWIPFHYDTETPSHLSEVLLNVAIFVPFGLYLGLLDRGPVFSILAGAGFSLLMEALQYAFAIGMTDVTDLLMNTLGTAIGYGLFALLLLLVKDRKKLRRILNIPALICTVLFFAFAAVLLIANR